MGDSPVATLRPNGSGGVLIYYVHTDAVGSPRKVTRPSDNGLMWRWDPDTFGSVAPNGNPAGLGTFSYKLRFPGQYALSESGLNYNYLRDYDPQMGRYLESDPIGLYGGSWSTYAYALDNPVTFSDPFGTNVTMTCRPLRNTGVATHCGMVVWHWSNDCPPKKIIDRQFSTPGWSTGPTRDSNNPTYVADLEAFNNSGGANVNYGIPVPESMTSNQFDAAVISSGDNFHNPWYNPFGPNSNTASAGIIIDAGGTVPNVPGAVGEFWQPPPTPVVPRF